ncbi:MAG: hypothetical protein ABDH16_02370 [Thermodesulfovibrionaceae bacterium]
MLQAIQVILFILLFASSVSALTIFDLCQIHQKNCIITPSREPETIYITKTKIVTRNVQALSTINASYEQTIKQTDENRLITEEIIATVEILPKPEDVNINITQPQSFDFEEILPLFENEMIIEETENEGYLIFQKARLIERNSYQEGKVQEILNRALQLKQEANKLQSKLIYPTIDTSDFLLLCQAEKVDCLTIRDAVLVRYSKEEQISSLLVFSQNQKQRFKIDGYIVLLTDEAKKELEATLKFSYSSPFNQPKTTTITGNIPASIEGLFKNYFWEIGLKLKALEQKSMAKILSNPSVVVDDRETASIGSGVQIPAVTPATTSTPATVTWKSAVLGLQVTPYKLPNGMIKMEITLSKDFPDYANQISGNIPINTNNLTTTVTVKPFQTIALGGIKEQSEASNREAPAIPILSWIFGSKSKSSSTRELYIFLAVEQL